MKMNNYKSRFGGSKVTIFIVILLVLIIAGTSLSYTYFTGKELQENQEQCWNQAFTYFSQKQPEFAYLELIKARSTFSESLDFYRKIATGCWRRRLKSMAWKASSPAIMAKQATYSGCSV